MIPATDLLPSLEQIGGVATAVSVGALLFFLFTDARERRRARWGPPSDEPREDRRWNLPRRPQARHSPTAESPDGGESSEPQRSEHSQQRRAIPKRFANVAFSDTNTGATTSRVEHQQQLTVRVSIGALLGESAVADAVAFPADTLPDEDLQIEVVLVSPHLNPAAVDAAGRERGTSHRLLLPADGGPARSADGEPVVEFSVRVPDTGSRFRARLSYLYGSAVVQSQRIDLCVGEAPRVTTDFTLSSSLGGDIARAVRPRSRVTMVVNDGPETTHQVTIRVGDRNGHQIGDAVGVALPGVELEPLVRTLRSELHVLAPDRRHRTKQQLREDLRRLAPLGWKLYASLPGAARRAIRTAASTQPDLSVQVLLTDGVRFTVPWSYVYDVYLPDGPSEREYSFCPLVEEWDGEAPLLASEVRNCPRAADHRDGTLCPFGFWGFRYDMEVLASTGGTAPEHIRVPADSRLVVAETQQGVDTKAVDDHISTLQATMGFTTTSVATTRDKLRSEIERDMPILYFLCHGEHYDGTTVLGIGKGERVTPRDLVGWMDAAFDKDGRWVWTDPRPFVFVNACESFAIDPSDLVDYVRVFVSDAGAVGAVGTEARVHQGLARDLAEQFFAVLFASPSSRAPTVGDALHAARSGFLQCGNLFGLAYTPYCSCDLTVARLPEAGSAVST